MLNCGEYKDYNFVWLVDKTYDGSLKFERTTFKKVESLFQTSFSVDVIRLLGSSRFVFFTHNSPLSGFSKKDGQTVVNLWHGCGYKDRKTNDSWITKNPFDYALVPGKVFIKIKSKFWSCKTNQVLPIGYPRYDDFFSINQFTKDYYRNLKENCKFLFMWMPTYRKTDIGTFSIEKMNNIFELPVLSSEMELEKLNDYCRNKKIKICIKRHPLQKRYESESSNFSNICFIDNNSLDKMNVNLYGLMSLIDGLITDYSSTAIDFLLLNKAIGFTLDDMDKYKEAQGFVFSDPLKYMPGDYICTFNDMTKFLNDVSLGMDKNFEKRHKILEEVHNPCLNYCERICKELKI